MQKNCDFNDCNLEIKLNSAFDYTLYIFFALLFVVIVDVVVAVDAMYFISLFCAYFMAYSSTHSLIAFHKQFTLVNLGVS